VIAVRLLAPTSLDELRAELGGAEDPVIVGGGVGLMSAAFAPTFGETNVALRGMTLDYVDDGCVGAMTPLATLERSDLGGRRALAQALRLTATPALRRRITLGGVLGWGSARADAAVALAAHGASAKVLDGRSGGLCWHAVADLYALPRPWVVLEVDLGQTGASRYLRFGGHHRATPALVCVAARRAPDGSTVVCVGGATQAPLVVTPDELPVQLELLDDHAASASFRHQVMRTLVADACRELDEEDRGG
jgi:CO/xanthine dehydrogenase FAD-binding subunit